MFTKVLPFLSSRHVINGAITYKDLFMFLEVNIFYVSYNLPSTTLYVINFNYGKKKRKGILPRPLLPNFTGIELLSLSWKRAPNLKDIEFLPLHFLYTSW